MWTDGPQIALGNQFHTGVDSRFRRSKCVSQVAIQRLSTAVHIPVHSGSARRAQIAHTCVHTRADLLVPIPVFCPS
jgi:hypothetical protein